MPELEGGPPWYSGAHVFLVRCLWMNLCNLTHCTTTPCQKLLLSAVLDAPRSSLIGVQDDRSPLLCYAAKQLKRARALIIIASGPDRFDPGLATAPPPIPRASVAQMTTTTPPLPSSPAAGHGEREGGGTGTGTGTGRWPVW
jgi:hypothetical protein